MNVIFFNIQLHQLYQILLSAKDVYLLLSISSNLTLKYSKSILRTEYNVVLALIYRM
jgi:hypothetical protein